MKVDALIVEDDPKVSNEIQALLQRHLPGSKFTKAANIEEVNDIVERARKGDTSYDIITVDLRIPANGEAKIFNDLPSRLRAAFPGASVVIFSANLNQSVFHELTASGDVHVVEKFHISDMFKAVMTDLGKMLVSRLRASVGESRRLGLLIPRRANDQPGCSTATFNGVLHEILSVYKDLPGDIRGDIQHYVSIEEDNGELVVDFPTGP